MRTRTWAIVTIAAMAFVVVHLSVTEVPPLAVTVEGWQFQFEPAEVRLKVRVERDVANRALAVGLISAEYETSSLEQLDGAAAPITRWLTYRHVPAGHYRVVAEVYRPPHTPWRADTSLRVLAKD